MQQTPAPPNTMAPLSFDELAVYSAINCTVPGTTAFLCCLYAGAIWDEATHWCQIEHSTRDKLVRWSECLSGAARTDADLTAMLRSGPSCFTAPGAYDVDVWALWVGAYAFGFICLLFLSIGLWEYWYGECVRVGVRHSDV